MNSGMCQYLESGRGDGSTAEENQERPPVPEAMEENHSAKMVWSASAYP
jgi:hypothetical protein